jgi:uncharacterized damage-inducible protein DinB
MSSPAIEAYKTRIASFIEGKDPLAVQRQTPAALAELIGGVPDAKLHERPGPEKWSVAELLAHFADAEIVSTWRYRQMLEHDGTPLTAYNQELWHKLGQYESRKPQDSLQMFRLLREVNLRTFDELTEEQWERKGVHAERGPTTVRDLVRQVAGHDLNHLEQIRKILGG